MPAPTYPAALTRAIDDSRSSVDCSIQRRNQKVIEESSSPLLLPEQAEEVKASAERLALAVGYVGAGTVEFLYNPADRSFAFLEVNTRLQVEHSITEATTGVDLVKAQIRELLTRYGTIPFFVTDGWA